MDSALHINPQALVSNAIPLGYVALHDWWNTRCFSSDMLAARIPIHVMLGT